MDRTYNCSLEEFHNNYSKFLSDNLGDPARTWNRDMNIDGLSYFRNKAGEDVTVKVYLDTNHTGEGVKFEIKTSIILEGDNLQDSELAKGLEKISKEVTL